MTIYVDIKSSWMWGSFQVHFSQARSALFRGTGLSCRFDKKTHRGVVPTVTQRRKLAEAIRKEIRVKSHMVDVQIFSVGSEPDLDVADFLQIFVSLVLWMLWGHQHRQV